MEPEHGGERMEHGAKRVVHRVGNKVQGMSKEPAFSRYIIF
ncbi:hypothetical protein ACFLZT_07725 [Thermodesulfobacteriota bacterium]